MRRHDRRTLLSIAAFIGGLHVLGWGLLLAAALGGHFAVGSEAFGAGIGLTAYMLGLRHAFDADHIAAIDNTTRRLMSRGQRPVSVGFWFSLGHSTVVFLLALLIALGVRSLPHQVISGSSALHDSGVVIGTLVSAGFLFLVAVLNLGSFMAMLRLRPGQSHPHAHTHDVEAVLARRGLVNRIVARSTNPVERPIHMYAVGLLFGLGFDTATEVALLVTAGTGAASGLPWYAIISLPLLFAAGMSMADTLDGSLMQSAYRRALTDPAKARHYNLTVTGLSILIATTVGVIEMITLLAPRLGADNGAIGWLAGLNLNTMGYVIVGLFVLTWAVSLGLWRLRDARVGPTPAGPVQAG